VNHLSCAAGSAVTDDAKAAKAKRPAAAAARRRAKLQEDHANHPKPRPFAPGRLPAPQAAVVRGQTISLPGGPVAEGEIGGDPGDNEQQLHRDPL